MKKKPNDGQSVLVWDGNFWEYAWYTRGDFWGAHHSSSYGNKLSDVEHWMEQPPAPKGNSK